jgi:hypothetical protein
MAGSRIIFPEFRDEQADSKYPFADTASLQTADGALSLPRNGIIDAAIYAINSSNRAFLSRVIVRSGAVTIVIGDEDNIDVARATYNPLSAPENGTLYLQDGYGRPAGILLVTDFLMALLGGWPAQEHVFNPEDTEFVSSVVMPAREDCVRAIQSEDGINFLTGDVWLVGGAGVVVRQESEEVIRIDINGEPLFKRLLCADADAPYAPGPFLQTINGCGPDEYGNFNITAMGQNKDDTVLRVYPDKDALKIELVGKKVV